MPLYEAKGNVQHSELFIKKGEIVDLPEGEKSDLLVLVSDPVRAPEPAPVVVDEAAAVDAETPFDDVDHSADHGKKKRGKKWFGSDESKDG